MRWCACPVPETLQLLITKGGLFSGGLMVVLCFFGYLKLIGSSALNISLSWLIYFDITTLSCLFLLPFFQSSQFVPTARLSRMGVEVLREHPLPTWVTFLYFQSRREWIFACLECFWVLYEYFTFSLKCGEK